MRHHPRIHPASARARLAAIISGSLAAVAMAAGPLVAQGFGQSVLVSGDEVLVGESLYATRPGYVYVYHRDGSGKWVEAGRLQASDAAPNDHFGRALALAQGDLLVGATIARESGALYVFSKSPRGWRETASIVPNGAKPADSFGRMAATDGRTVIMSDWAADSSRGAVYVFEKQNGAWRETAKLAASDGQPNDWFGFAIAIRDDRIVASAINKNAQRGGAYVFRRTANGWQEAAQIAPPDTTANLGFGASVALMGDDVILSAPGADGFVGAVYTYRSSGTAWTQAAKTPPPTGTQPNGTFGAVLTVAGDELWVGAQGIGGGQVYRLARNGDGVFTHVAAITGRETIQGDGFGGAISMNGSLAVAGLIGDDFGLGSAAVLEKRGANWVEAGRLASEVPSIYSPITGGKVDCTGGKAAQFDCGDVDILSFLPVSAIGGTRGVQVNDTWGWTDTQTGREWAIVGRYDGTSFIDISDPSNPVYVGNLPLHEGARPNVWRDIKVYKDHAYIVSDGAGPHGMQVFDLARLRNIPKSQLPKTFTEDAHYDRIASAHNIVINEATGFAYAVGANSGGETCGGGLHMIDIREPLKPKFAGCFQDMQTGNQRTGYSHDAQCVTYRGPDAKYAGHEICFGSNETALSIADVTSKDSTVAISRAAYPSVGYAHQGWLDEQHEYFYMDDEGDETNGSVQHTRTLVWDVKDLDDPILVKEYFGSSTSSDHNLYIRGNLMYQSNYVSGLRIVDISNRAEPKEVGFLDTVPGNDAPGFDGSWSNYPFFASGTIIVTSGKEGVFFVRRRVRPVS
jgi:choice-of-anchor B domain-containing protein